MNKCPDGESEIWWSAYLAALPAATARTINGSASPREPMGDEIAWNAEVAADGTLRMLQHRRIVREEQRKADDEIRRKKIREDAGMVDVPDELYDRRTSAIFGYLGCWIDDNLGERIRHEWAKLSDADRAAIDAGGGWPDRRVKRVSAEFETSDAAHAWVAENLSALDVKQAGQRVTFVLLPNQDGTKPKHMPIGATFCRIEVVYETLAEYEASLRAPDAAG